MVRSMLFCRAVSSALDAPLHLEGMAGDDVAHGVGLLLRLLKGAAGRGPSPALLGQLTVPLSLSL